MIVEKDIYTARLAQIRTQFDLWKVDAVLIDNPANMRWLSGFTDAACRLLVTRRKALLATDFRFWEQAAIQSPTFTLYKLRRRRNEMRDLFKKGGATVIGIEANSLTIADKAKLDRLDGLKWVALPGTVESFRSVKSAAELNAIRAAAVITDKAMAQVNELARAGMTEKALAWELEKIMREKGADSMAFTVIVASGPNSSLPHHHPGERKLQAGDAIVVDMGALLNGYHSDMTRSFYLGESPTDKFWEIYNLTLAAHTAVFDHARAGMSGKEIDAFARDLINGAGHKEHFGHGLGHGVGLEIHENPRISSGEKSAKETAVVGMTMTIEPGVYLPGWGGIRIEDLAVMTENGLEYISHCPKNPIIK